ncbi:preprotein translocase subunit SecE [Patescibacteria group bacterium]|nr:preprotein translocase subunit SecE [Patescibacteria group bacterium]MBU2036400.1 preprotein translocase subunit SecE [Patescibacteria group bacterium]
MLKFVLVNKVINYLKEVKLELSKVTWPKKNQVIKLTLIVFVISGIVAIYVGGLDFIFTKALEFIVKR